MRACIASLRACASAASSIPVLCAAPLPLFSAPYAPIPALASEAAPAMSAAVVAISQHLHVDMLGEIEAQLWEQRLGIIDGPEVVRDHLNICACLQIRHASLDQHSADALAPMLG